MPHHTWAALAVVAFLQSSLTAQTDGGFTPASALPDLSGMTPVGRDLFLAVHDAKNPDELDRPRVSLLMTPTDLDGVLWKPLDVDWNGMESSDLESAARIPRTRHVLFAESGDDGDPTFQRIFRGRLTGTHLSIERVVDWPVSVFNVEATAVARFGDRFVFLYAERAQNEAFTFIRWALFDPNTLEFRPFRTIRLDNPDPDNTNRPVVALDVDPAGRIYTVAAFDAEAADLPDPDNGPFRSSVWHVGSIRMEHGHPQVHLRHAPRRLGTLDGFKVESVAVVPRALGGPQVYVGLDDENFGATLRRLPPIAD